MSEPRDAAAFYLPQGLMDIGTWKGIHKTKKEPKTTDGGSRSGRKKRRKAVDDDNCWYSEAALHDDVDAADAFEEDIPREA